jgi:hypothetical protein
MTPIQARDHGLLVEPVLEILSVVLLQVLGKVLIELSNKKFLFIFDLIRYPEGLNLFEG